MKKKIKGIIQEDIFSKYKLASKAKKKILAFQNMHNTQTKRVYGLEYKQKQ